MDVLLIVACFYFAFSQAKALVDYGNQPWELVHYLLLFLTLALAGLGLWRSWMYYKDWKYKKEHPEEAEVLGAGEAVEEDADDTEEEDDGEEEAAEVSALPEAEEAADGDEPKEEQ